MAPSALFTTSTPLLPHFSETPFRVDDDEWGVQRDGPIPRSASHTYLPEVTDSAANKETLQRPSLPRGSSERQSQGSFSEQERQQPTEFAPYEDARSRFVANADKRRFFGLPDNKSAVSRVIPVSAAEAENDAVGPMVSGIKQRPGQTVERRRTQSEKIKNFARRSWTSSRSSSPSSTEKDAGRDGAKQQQDREAWPLPLPAATPNGDHANGSARFAEETVNGHQNANPGKERSRPSARLRKRTSSPKKLSPSEYGQSPSSSVPRLPNGVQSSGYPTPSPLQISRSLSSKASGLSLNSGSSLKPDALAKLFRTLDVEFQQFEIKNAVFKANNVRTILLPFLRDYAHHPSNKILRAEDLEKRIGVLNRWWMGLLDMLSNPTERAISWTDRHSFIEGISGIMARPEWRTAPSEFSPLADRYPRNVYRAGTFTSLDSPTDFISESVHHNIRNIFVSNLLAQMSFVVNAMSQRSAPPSLVALCGKTAAYAFFFCPSVANILVRLWKTPPGVLRRVLDEFGISNESDFNGKHEDIVYGFPKSLHPLRFVSFDGSVKSIWRPKKGDVPLGTERIEWNGKWTKRWSGRDTDLFFIFCKYFYSLFAEFLPPGSRSSEHICAPGFLYVNAQLLTIIDSTIHRHNEILKIDALHGPSSITFDDVLEGPDVTAIAALSLPIAELERPMAENRLIMLLREFLSDSNPKQESSQQIFANAIGGILRAAAKRTSLYDQAACFTLCELLEEALQILMAYQDESGTKRDYVDWPFWQLVCQRMLDSENSITEIRMFSFLYTMWNTIANDPARKSKLCLGWLLTETAFERHFAHWCPMVRAYFMRLICWRVAHYTGEASEVDVKILYAASTRLKAIWYKFCFLSEEAWEDSHSAPTTSPSCPAPGRRFAIVSNPKPPPLPSVFLTLDPIAHANSDPSPSPIKQDTPTFKGWKALRSIIGITSELPLNPNSTGSSSNTTTTNSTGSSTTITNSSTSSSSSNPTTSPHTRSSTRHPPPPPLYKFSLAPLPHPPSQRPKSLNPPRLPDPAARFLHAKMSHVFDIAPRIAPHELTQPMKYSGRALAEWAIVLTEAASFWAKRRQEGDDSGEEVPGLGVESFRRLGG